MAFTVVIAGATLAGLTVLLAGCQPSLAPTQAAAESAQSTNAHGNATGTNSSTGSQGSSSTSASSLPQVQAYQSDSFVDSIGVVTHLTYTDTNYYLQWSNVFNDLQLLGVRHLRDGYYNWTPGTPFYAEHRQLASAGIKTDYVIPYNTSTTAQALASIAPEVGDMEAVEAPNECDIAGDCGSTAAQSMANMLAFLPTVDVSGTTTNVPVFGPSFATYTSYAQVGNLASEMTDNNLHVYFGGRNPGSPGWGGLDAEGHSYGSIPFWLDMANQDAPNIPVNITETGYMMFTQPQQYTIPPSTGASYIPRTLLLAYKQGVKRTYMYELLDEVSSPGYGLIDGNMNPKPAFLAVQNLIANLWDKGSSFTPGTLSYSLTGGGSTLEQVLFQKRDGSFWLVLWLEQSSYDEVNLVQTPVTPENVTLQVGGNYVVTNIGTIENTGNMSWISTNPAAATETISVSDAVTIVKILPSN
jgi:hypothetical protein